MILFFGPPGSGKSVQGQLLVERNGWVWLSTGVLFRQSDNPEVLSKLAAGELIDDELTNKVVDDALKEVVDNTRIILDGYPRNVDQSKWLVNRLPRHDREIAAIVVFEATTEEIISRLSSRGRPEDVPAVIERRLAIYHEKTKPLLDYFKGVGVPLCEIDAVGDIQTVHNRIEVALAACIRD